MRIVPFVLLVLNATAAIIHAWKGNTAFVVLNVGAVILLVITTPTRAK